MTDRAPDLYAAWAAATSPKIERLSAAASEAGSATQDLVGEGHDLYRKIARAYRAGKAAEAKRLAGRWLTLQGKRREAMDRQEAISLEFMAEKFRLVLGEKP